MSCENEHIIITFLMIGAVDVSSVGIYGGGSGHLWIDPPPLLFYTYIITF